MVVHCQKAQISWHYLFLLINKSNSKPRDLLPSGTKTKVAEEEQSSNLNYKNFSFYFQI